MTSLVYRALGVSVFDGGTFESIEADRKATLQSLLVVLASSLAGAIAATRSLEPRLTFIAAFMTVAVVTWLGWAQLILLIGGYQFRRPETRVDYGELVRTTGFAAAPGVLQILALVSTIATPVRSSRGSGCGRRWSSPSGTRWMIAASGTPSSSAAPHSA
jgi:hypothetical protein